MYVRTASGQMKDDPGSSETQAPETKREPNCRNDVLHGVYRANLVTAGKDMKSGLDLPISGAENLDMSPTLTLFIRIRTGRYVTARFPRAVEGLPWYRYIHGAFPLSPDVRKSRVNHTVSAQGLDVFSSMYPTF